MKRCRWLGVGLLLVLFFMMVGVPGAYAAVTTTPEAAAGGDAIYVAGNPDAYPMEYYSTKSGKYEGIFPTLLEEVSKDTGLDFIYIQAQPEDRRKQMARNRQVEIVSCCEVDTEWFKDNGVKPGQTVVSFKDEQGETVRMALAYTDIADAGVVKNVESAMQKATKAHLANIAVGVAVSNPIQETPPLLIGLAVLVVVLTVALVVVMVYAYRYRKKSQEKAHIDFRTGIYNKAYLLEYYEKFISDRYRNLYAVVYIAFNISTVQERYSEEAAERQLCEAANELRLSVRDNEVVARVSGGGFAIIRFSGGAAEAVSWTESILERLNGMIVHDGALQLDERTRFYGGIYMLEPSDRDCEKVLFKAQKGYIKAIEAGVPCCLTEQSFLVEEAKEQALNRELLEGLKNGEFQMFLQFGVLAKDGSISGAEAFSRWNHPSRGLLYPGSYIPLFEDQGTLPELDFFIFEEACRTLVQWQEKGRSLIISCNFARMTIEKPDFVQRLEAIAKKYTFNRRLLAIEVSQSAMERNHLQTFENISKCHDLGFAVSLDDVGRGEMNINDLRNEAISLVKLDRELLNATVTPRGEALLRGMIELVHGMGMFALCEGVETAPQVEMLRKIGCDMIQGYYFYHPLPLEEAERVLAKTEKL